ncbi:MAG: hypothetical protein ACJAVI_003364 [Candidatus Azotimanducaceae bacterium]|jgi:hypothetical protein
MGKTNRMPNTAIRIPEIKKYLCKRLSMSFNAAALTIALSNDKLISSIAKMITRLITVANGLPLSVAYQAASTKQAILKRFAGTKYLTLFP